MFIDGFVSWYALTSDIGKENFKNKAPKIDIEVPDGLDLKFSQETTGSGPEMECVHAVISSKVSQVKMTDAPPPGYPARMIVATIESSSKSYCSMSQNIRH